MLCLSCDCYTLTDLKGPGTLPKAFDKMSKSHNPFQVMIDAVPEMAWCSLPDGSVEFLNQRWHDYTGLSPQEAHCWGWKAAIHPRDLTSLMDKWQALLRNGCGMYRSS